MTNTIHPWTMYEVARSRDEERMLRARDARAALRAKRESAGIRADAVEAAPRVSRIRYLSPFAWAHGLHLRPARHG
jgi:hypothetical protein